MASSTELQAPAREAGADPPPPSGAQARPIIAAAGLSKSFRIPTDAPQTIKERVLHPFRRTEVRELQAVRDLSFEIHRGEFFGIVGRNGSGKSTLLKLIAQIYRPDTGTVYADGRLSPFIELGVGFHPELAARDNVVINCSLLGLTRTEALRRFDRIVEFAELERFVDLKLKNYSTGMQVRLAFSTAIQVDAQILLLDEVLAVGDSRFQEKCFEAFRQMKSAGRTIVFVTHNMDLVQRFCDRAMLIDAGRLQAIGDPHHIAERYMMEVGAEKPPEGMYQETGRYGDGAAEVLEAWFEDPAGSRVEQVEQGNRFKMCAEVTFHRDMQDPVMGFNLRNERGENVFMVNTAWDEEATGRFEAGARARVEATFDNILAVGRYFGDPLVAHRDETRVADLREGMATVVVKGRRWTPAAVEAPHELSVKRL